MTDAEIIRTACAETNSQENGDMDQLTLELCAEVAERAIRYAVPVGSVVVRREDLKLLWDDTASHPECYPRLAAALGEGEVKNGS